MPWVTRRREQLRRVGISIALVIFVAGLVWSLRSAPNIGSRFQLVPALLLLVIGAPVTTPINALELYAISRISGGPMSWRTCVELTVYSTAANMLPLPGAALTRLAAMKAHGVGFALGSAMLVLSFGIWGAFAFCYSAAALLWLGHELIATAFFAAGASTLISCLLVLGKIGPLRLVGLLLLARVISLPLDALRFMLATAALSAGVGFAQASIFSVASFTSAAVIVVPSGLGIREAVVALLSPFASIDPAVGFLVASLARIVWMVGLALVTGVVLVSGSTICLRRVSPIAGDGDH